MHCPVCDSRRTKVLDSRESKDGGIRRRRVCSDCGHRFTTYERVDEALPTVIKRDGTRQTFDREKLMRGLQAACRKRPVTVEQLELIVASIEKWAGTRGDREVPADGIGERVIHHLHELDAVAYVRFVSVYRSFETVEEFAHLLREMEKAEAVNVEGQRQLFEPKDPDADGPPSDAGTDRAQRRGAG